MEVFTKLVLIWKIGKVVIVFKVRMPYIMYQSRSSIQNDPCHSIHYPHGRISNKSMLHLWIHRSGWFPLLGGVCPNRGELRRVHMFQIDWQYYFYVRQREHSILWTTLGFSTQAVHSSVGQVAMYLGVSVPVPVRECLLRDACHFLIDWVKSVPAEAAQISAQLTPAELFPCHRPNYL